MMDSLEYAVLTVICVNMMLILGTMSATHINPNFDQTLINCEKSPLGQYGNCTNGGYTMDTSNPTLPTSSTSVDTTTGGVFTDIWNTIKGFFGDTLGLKYVSAVVGAPKTFLLGLGVDTDFASLIGAVWWIVSVLLLISYIKR